MYRYSGEGFVARAETEDRLKQSADMRRPSADADAIRQGRNKMGSNDALSETVERLVRREQDFRNFSIEKE